MKNQQYEQLAEVEYPARRATTNRLEALAERLDAGAAALAAIDLNDNHQTRKNSAAAGRLWKTTTMLPGSKIAAPCV